MMPTILGWIFLRAPLTFWHPRKRQIFCRAQRLRVQLYCWAQWLSRHWAVNARILGASGARHFGWTKISSQSKAKYHGGKLIAGRGTQQPARRHIFYCKLKLQGSFAIQEHWPA